MSRAFTLVEVLITTALSTILLLVIVQLYILYSRTIIFQQASIDVTLGASSIMDTARTAGLQAKRVVATHVFSGVSYSSDMTTVIFELPSIDSSGVVVPNTYDYIGIYASGSNAYRRIDAAPGSVRVTGEKRLTNVLNALSFVYDNPSFPLVKNITVDATTSAMIRGETTQTHLRERVHLRNL